MRVSVIISNYNYADFLSTCIDSVLAQSEPVDEIIVVDDGSTDNSHEVIQSYGGGIILIFQNNGGQAAAINAGFAKATGDIICLLDADDIFYPDKIKILKNTYSKNPDSKWIFHCLDKKSEDGAVMLRPVVSIPFKNINKMTAMREGRLNYHAPATSGLSFRRDFVRELFPLPTAESIFISDHYIKFYTLASSEGLDISTALGAQTIHPNNRYTGKNTNAVKAKILVNAGYHLYQKMPELKKFCSKLVCEGLLCGKRAEISQQVEEVAGKYLSILNPYELFLFKCRLAVKMIFGNVH